MTYFSELFNKIAQYAVSLSRPSRHLFISNVLGKNRISLNFDHSFMQPTFTFYFGMEWFYVCFFSFLFVSGPHAHKYAKNPDQKKFFGEVSEIYYDTLLKTNKIMMHFKKRKKNIRFTFIINTIYVYCIWVH